MKVTYIEKGFPFNYKRIDTIKTFFAESFFKPENTEIIYFRLDRFNMKTISFDEIVSVEF